MLRIFFSPLIFRSVFASPIRLLSSSSTLFSGLSRHNIHPSNSVDITQLHNPKELPFWDPKSGTPMPEASFFFLEIPSIHAPNFFDIVFELLNFINEYHHPLIRKCLFECILEGNRYRSLRSSFTLGKGFTKKSNN